MEAIPAGKLEREVFNGVGSQPEKVLQGRSMLCVEVT